MKGGQRRGWEGGEEVRGESGRGEGRRTWSERKGGEGKVTSGVQFCE